MSPRSLFTCIFTGLIFLTNVHGVEDKAASLAARTKILATLTQLNQVLETNPQDRKALLARGHIHQELGAGEQARDDFRAVLELDATNADADRAFEQAFQTPLHSFEEIETLLTESAEALIAGQSQRAADSFLLADLYRPNLGDVNLGIATLYAQRGDRLAAATKIDLARADYLRAVYSDGELSPDAHIGLARLLAAEKKFTEAVAEIDLVKTDDEDEKARAVAARRDILALLPLAERTRFMESIEAMLARARALSDNGNRQQALNVYEFILLRNPRLIAAYESRARLARQPSDAARDRAIVEELRAPEPDLPGPDDASFAITQANRAVHRRPFASRPYIERSLLLSSTGKKPEARQKAIADAKLAIELEPFDPRAHMALCEALLAARRDINAFNISEREEQAVHALEAADRALALAPDDFELLIWRGRTESENGIRLGQNQHNAARFFTRAIAQDPTSTKALYWHAGTAEKSENNEAAAADYRTILQLDESDIAANYHLGWANLRLGKPREAAENFKIAREKFLQIKEPENARIGAQLHAVALAMAGDDSCDAVAQAALDGADWVNDASIALNNFTQKKHSPQLDRLKKMKGKPAS